MGVPGEMPQGLVLQSPEGLEPQKRDPAIQAMLDGERIISLKGSSIKAKRGKYLNRFYEVEDEESTYPTKSAIPDGESKIDLKPDPTNLVTIWALLSPARQFVIDKIKAPKERNINHQSGCIIVKMCIPC